jgi:hypothetical protein
MPTTTLVELGHQLGDDEFVEWVRTRSPRVQVEILSEAPEAVRQHMYKAKVLQGQTIQQLNRIKLNKGGR